MTEQEFEQEVSRHVKAIIVAFRRYFTDYAQAQNKEEEKEPVLKRS